MHSQVCGALKNVVAVAAGFCDGLGQGTNTKAAILRLGVEEIQIFIMLFFGELLAVGPFDTVTVKRALDTKTHRVVISVYVFRRRFLIAAAMLM